ncbi:MAG: hypothetical protein ACOYMG_08300 [Candidatus Methylumidiphilus sp.]
MGLSIVMTPTQVSWQTEVTLPVGYLDEESGQLHRLIALRKMTGREEALLSDPSLRSNGGKLITALLGNCVIGIEGVKPVDASIIRQLSSADRNFLLLELRRLTFGDEMEAQYRCPKCQGVTAVLEDLSSLDVRELETGALPETRVTLKDGYQDPDGNWQFEFLFVLPTGEDEEVAAGRRDKNAARQRDVLLARCLRQVGDLDPKRIRALGSRILSDLSMADRRLIQQAMDEQAPGPDLSRYVTCNQCGEGYRAGLDMSFFFPLE